MDERDVEAGPTEELLDTTPLARPPEQRPETMTMAKVASKYRIEGEVGRGGMGIVYLGVQESLGRRVALKLLRAGHSQQRFMREARVLAQLTSPHLVAVHELVELDDGRLMLVMEWIDGEDLARALQRQGAPNEHRALAWMEQTCLGMLAAEEQGVVHRDLKPSNILIDRKKNNARVADFGLARMHIGHDFVSLTNQTLGTPHYMAPEQAEDPKSADVRSDIYSFGATFYHVLTGQTPFSGETPFAVMFKHKTEPLASLRSISPHVSTQTAEVVERCLSKRPADRFQSFAEILPFCRPAEASPWDVTEPELAALFERFRQRKQLYLHSPKELREPDVYRVTPSRWVTIEYDNIVYADVDAIVSSDDQNLSRGGGVSAAISHAAWNAGLAEEINRLTPVRPGRAVITSAGRMRCRFILHGVTQGWSETERVWPTRQLILDVLNSCFYHADSVYVKSVALPLLGTGASGFDREQCLDLTFQFLCKTLARGMTSVREARIVLFNR